jgi:MYXO-CTERM domain-containing protein
VFNDGVGLTGEFFGGGHASLDAFADAPSRELAVSLANMRAGGGAATFPDNTIRLLVWTDKGTGADGLPVGFPGDDGLNYDVSGVINYTLAVPEPSACGLALAGVVSLAARRRRR